MEMNHHGDGGKRVEELTVGDFERLARASAAGELDLEIALLEIALLEIGLSGWDDAEKDAERLRPELADKIAEVGDRVWRRAAGDEQ